MQQIYKDIERPYKREAQTELTSSLIDYKPENYIPGDIYILSGPDPLGAVKQYDNINLGNPILIEKDRKTYEVAKRRLNDIDTKYPLFNVDLFEILKKQHSCISELDIDLCDTLNTDIRVSISESLQSIMLDNKLPCFWARITSCPRGIGKRGIFYAIEEIKDYCEAEELNYKISDEKYRPYPGDAGNGSMHIWQGYFINTLKEKEKEMKKVARKSPIRPIVGIDQLKPRRNKKGFQGLDDRDKEILKMLIEDGISPNEEIAKFFGISITSLAAVKANITRKK